MSRLLALSLALALAAVLQPAATAHAVPHTVTHWATTATGAPVIRIVALGGGPVDLKVAGSSNGILTFTDPNGLELSPNIGDQCSRVGATTVTCGTTARPVAALYVDAAWSSGVKVDLSRLAQQWLSSQGSYATPTAPEVERWMRGIFVRVTSGHGNDEVIGGDANALYELGAGNDKVTGGLGDELFRQDDAAFDGNDSFDGGGGYDTFSYARRTVGVRAVLADLPTTKNGTRIPAVGETDTLVQVEALAGGMSADDLSVSSPHLMFATLDGRGGFDVLTGGSGADKLIAGEGGGQLDGGDGADQLIGESGDFSTELEPRYSTLDGGPGDDEIIEVPSPLATFATRNQTQCGSGVDVVRRPAGLAPLMDYALNGCEVFAEETGVAATYAGDLRVGSTVALVPPPPRAPWYRTARVGSVTWTLCAGPDACETRTTNAAQLTLVAGDEGKTLAKARAVLNEPLSDERRWVIERAASLAAPLGSTFEAGAAGVVQPRLSPAPAKPTKADASGLRKAFVAALGKKPRVSLLRKKRAIAFAAPAGTSLAVTLRRRSKKTSTVLASGKATAGASGKVAIELSPTPSGRRASRSRRPLKLSVNVIATNSAGETSATSSLKLAAAK